MTAADRLPWYRPLRDRRCRAVRESHDGDPYSGRCELKAGHDGPHALERGFATPRWSTDLITAAYRLPCPVCGAPPGQPCVRVGEWGDLPRLEEP